MPTSGEGCGPGGKRPWKLNEASTSGPTPKRICPDWELPDDSEWNQQPAQYSGVERFPRDLPHGEIGDQIDNFFDDVTIPWMLGSNMEMDMADEGDDKRSDICETVPGKFPATRAETNSNIELGFDFEVGSSQEMADAPPEAISANEPVEPPQYNTCFGTILVNATSCFRSDGGHLEVPVDITGGGDILKLSLQEAGEYVGIIDAPAAITLHGTPSVLLRAMLQIPPAPGQKPKAKRSNKSPEVQMPHQYSVRIAVFGLMNQANEVGHLLSDAGLYLQHPSPPEYDYLVPYHNPHYLLRQGARMPSLQHSLDALAPETFYELNKRRFTQIFDTQATGKLGFGEAATHKQSRRLETTLKRHQLEALALMVERESRTAGTSKFPTIWRAQNSPNGAILYQHKITLRSDPSPGPLLGGILADEMGLGKTLSMLALICWTLDGLEDKDYATSAWQSQSTLVVAPKSAMQSWSDQMARHIDARSTTMAIYHGSSRTLTTANIVLTTYETMRSEWSVRGPLYSKPWLRVVLDEAHHIRTRSSQVFQAASMLEAHYRWCLTGTPIHNSLDDYGALLSFLKIQPFIEKRAFDFWIATPISKKEHHALRKLEFLIQATCLRRTKSLAEISSELPGRTERIKEVELFPADRELYTFFQRQAARLAVSDARFTQAATHQSNHNRGSNIIRYINVLRLICDHGEHLLPSLALLAWKNGHQEVLNWQTLPSGAAKSGMFEPYGAKPWGLNDDDLVANEPSFETCRTQIGAENCSPGLELRNSVLQPSAKVMALLQIVTHDPFSGQGGKHVVFTYWTRMLDLVQQSLNSSGIRFQRIDGQSNLQDRSTAIRRFNNEADCIVMLASIGSAAEGIDLTAANTVHLLEPHWNPMVEDQAIHRVHRIGQKRDVTIIRYITPNSIETYVQWIQNDKRRIIRESLDWENTSQREIDEERWKKLQSILNLEQTT